MLSKAGLIACWHNPRICYCSVCVGFHHARYLVLSYLTLLSRLLEVVKTSKKLRYCRPQWYKWRDGKDYTKHSEQSNDTNEDSIKGNCRVRRWRRRSKVRQMKMNRMKYSWSFQCTRVPLSLLHSRMQDCRILRPPILRPPEGKQVL